ncbi:hypothetical protein D3C71_1934560 [compost metagenome]
MLADGTEIAVGRATGAHVIFRVHLEEPKFGAIGNDLGVVLRLETEARPGRQCVEGHGILPWCKKREAAGASRWGDQLAMGRSRSSGSSEPMRSPSSIMVSQVPAGTAFQALP